MARSVPGCRHTAGQVRRCHDGKRSPFSGQAYHTAKKYLIETMGSGVALFDYDNDGRLDIFFANGAVLTDPTAPGTIPQKSGPKDSNRLYHQRLTERLKT
jgi:hypothetical protein